MQRLLRRFTLGVLLLSFVFAVRPAARGQAIEAAAVDAVLQEALKAWQAPGVAVVIVKGDEVVYIKGLGVRELGGPQPVTPDTLFAIASTSKAITTAAMAILVDEGKMAWDDPVRKHLDYFRLSDPLADRNVTLRDLVCHRTGLSRHDMLWYGSPWNREEIIRKIGLVQLTQPYRSTYQYQNIMFLTAGQVVGASSRSSWEEFVQKRLFDPLGMTGANFSSKVAEKAPDHATPHRRFKGKPEPIPWRNLDNCGPAGSINAGVRDLSKWIRLHLGDGVFEGKRLVSAANLRETRSPQMVIKLEGALRASNPDTEMMSYGLGWTIQDYRGHLLVSHGGSIDGFRSQVALLPKAKAGMAILSNLGRTQLPEAVRNNLVDLVLGLPRKDWTGHYLEQVKKSEAEQKKRDQERAAKRHKDTRPSRELAAYTGAYEEPAYGKASFALEKGHLVLQWSSFRGVLEHYHFDTFTVKDEQGREDNPLHNLQVVFSLAADGEFAGVKLLETDFRKVTLKPRATP